MAVISTLNLEEMLQACKHDGSKYRAPQSHYNGSDTSNYPLREKGCGCSEIRGTPGIHGLNMGFKGCRSPDCVGRISTLGVILGLYGENGKENGN